MGAEVEMRKKLGLKGKKKAMTLEEMVQVAEETKLKAEEEARWKQQVAEFEKQSWQNALDEVKREQAEKTFEQLQQWKESKVMKQAEKLDGQVKQAEHKYRGVAKAMIEAAEEE